MPVATGHESGPYLEGPKMSLAPGDVADRLFGLANGKPPQQRRQDSTLVYTSFHLAASSTGSRHDHLKVRFRCMVLLKGASSQRDLEVHLAKACAAKPWGKAFGWAIGCGRPDPFGGRLV